MGEDRSRRGSPAEDVLPGEEARLLEQIRAGDAEAGQQFVRAHYGAIYRYLLYLAGQPEQAEDLTQETSLQGWRYLDTFQGRGSLRGWLLRIARSEFLHLLRRRQTGSGAKDLDDVPAPEATSWIEAVELRAVISRLSLEERDAWCCSTTWKVTSKPLGSRSTERARPRWGRRARRREGCAVPPRHTSG
jgi:RNA polymerase sigma factor (sigma-70 family)